jgi:LemA protein
MEIVLGIVIAVAVMAIVIYNRLVALRQGTKQAFADIDVQLKYRSDLIPNLVETVKGYATHEKALFENVTAARATALRGGSVGERAQNEAALGQALMQLMAVAENYPQLRADANFRQLQGDLSDVENKLAASRRFFNSAVGEYNTAIQQFPAVLFAAQLGFTMSEMFDVGEAARQTLDTPPAVKF